jgi:hypothetical protein
MDVNQIIEQITKKQPASKAADDEAKKLGPWGQEVVIKLMVLGREEEARMFLNVMLGDDDEKKKGVGIRYWTDDALYTEEVNKLVEERCQASSLTINAADDE